MIYQWISTCICSKLRTKKVLHERKINIYALRTLYVRMQWNHVCLYVCALAKDDSDDEDGPKKKICIEEQEGEEEPKPTKSHQRAQFQIILMTIRVQREKSESKFTFKRRMKMCDVFRRSKGKKNELNHIMNRQLT